MYFNKSAKPLLLVKPFQPARSRAALNTLLARPANIHNYLFLNIFMNSAAQAGEPPLGQAPNDHSHRVCA